jgi:hypothetical protein
MRYNFEEVKQEADGTNTFKLVRFHVLAAMSMKMAVLWDAGQCTVIGTDRSFRAVTVTLTVKSVISSETSVNIYQTTWCNILWKTTIFKCKSKAVPLHYSGTKRRGVIAPTHS